MRTQGLLDQSRGDLTLPLGVERQPVSRSVKDLFCQFLSCPCLLSCSVLSGTFLSCPVSMRTQGLPDQSRGDPTQPLGVEHQLVSRSCLALSYHVLPVLIVWGHRDCQTSQSWFETTLPLGVERQLISRSVLCGLVLSCLALSYLVFPVSTGRPNPAAGSGASAGE